jgi:hypothetical protein
MKRDPKSNRREGRSVNAGWRNEFRPLRGMRMPTFLGLLGVLLASFPTQTPAAATLTLYDGVNPLITVFDNGPGDQIGALGVIQVQTNVGVWNLAISTAVTKPLVGSPTDPVMDLDVQANSTGAGSLRLAFSDNGFGPASGILNSIVTGHLLAGAATTVTYDVYGDPANLIGATTILIASTGTVPLPTIATGSGPLALPTPFSLTQVEQFDALGATTITSDASFMVVSDAVPEPGIMGLVALGLGVFAWGRPRRN